MAYIEIAPDTIFNFLDPKPESISLDHLTSALPHLARFTGHTKDEQGNPAFYSVAQHSVLVAEAAPDHLKFLGLMHDATEAYLGDVSSPLKSLLPQYSDIEANVWRAIAQKFDIKQDLSAIRQYDLEALATERRDLTRMSENATNWYILNNIEPWPEKIIPWSIDEARCRWLEAFHQYTNS